MLTTTRYILLTALRDRLFIGLMAAIALAFALSLFLGGASVVEERQGALAYAAGSSRMILTVGLIAFITFHVRRAVENREMEVWLTRPLPRGVFALSYFLGFASVGIVPALGIGAGLLALGADTSGALVWTATLTLETLLVTAFALFASLMLRSAALSMLSALGMTLISRMIGLFAMAADKPAAHGGDFFLTAANYTLKAISALLPRLDFFAKSEWLIYGAASPLQTLLLPLTQWAAYLPLLLLAIIFDFRRKEF